MTEDTIVAIFTKTRLFTELMGGCFNTFFLILIHHIGFGGTVTIIRTIRIDYFCAEGHRMSIATLSQFLEPNHILATVAIQLIS